MKNTRLELSRSQILSFRQRVGALDQRLPAGVKSLSRAAWAGLQDSMPRAALLSIHARVNNTIPTMLDNPSLVQLWGPRFSNYVVTAKDLPIFSLGRLPLDARRCARCHDTASRLKTFLRGRRMPFEVAGRAMGVQPNSLRYAAPTGTVLIHWDGARQPDIWTVPAPGVDVERARLELARRYLHIFAPAQASSFAQWAGISIKEAHNAFSLLKGTITVHTPVGDALILANDEPGFRKKSKPATSIRLLPSGDTYYLLWGAARKLLLPDAKQRTALWTTRVWPGALFMRGEIVGTWRRAAGEVFIETWRRLTSAEREAFEAEALSLPLPGLNRPVAVHFKS